MVKTNRRQKRKGEKILDLNDVAKIIQEYVHVTEESLEEAMEIFSKNSTPIL